MPVLLINRTRGDHDINMKVSNALFIYIIFYDSSYFLNAIKT